MHKTQFERLDRKCLHCNMNFNWYALCKLLFSFYAFIQQICCTETTCITLLVGNGASELVFFFFFFFSNR